MSSGDQTVNIKYHNYQSSKHSCVSKNQKLLRQTEDISNDRGGLKTDTSSRLFPSSPRHLVSSLHYVDSSKVCAWGWSYGGYLTGLLLAEVGIDSSARGVGRSEGV